MVGVGLLKPDLGAKKYCTLFPVCVLMDCLSGRQFTTKTGVTRACYQNLPVRHGQVVVAHVLWTVLTLVYESRVWMMHHVACKI